MKINDIAFKELLIKCLKRSKKLYELRERVLIIESLYKLSSEQEELIEEEVELCALL